MEAPRQAGKVLWSASDLLVPTIKTSLTSSSTFRGLKIHNVHLHLKVFQNASFEKKKKKAILTIEESSQKKVDKR